VEADDQAKSELQNAISLNLGRTIQDSVSNFTSPGSLEIPIAIEYQHSSGGHFSRFVAVNITYSYTAGSPTLAFEEVFEADWHPFNQGLNGWFFGVFLDTGYTNYDKSSGSFSSDLTIGIGPAVGYELTFPNRLFLEFAVGIGAGIGYNSGPFGSTMVATFPYRFDIALGFKF
jgi:hypothetical protein